MDPLTGLMFLTRWGNSVLLLPAACCIGASLWIAGDRGPAWRWILCFGGAVALVLASKLAFIGWGVGIRSLDFTGISGHSTLATAVLPMLAWWLTQKYAPTTRRFAVVIALALAICIALSRVLLSVHSIAEVAAGLLLGGAVVWIALPRRLAGGGRVALRWVVLAALLVAGSLPGIGESDEAHGLIVRIALQLSGRSEPFTRDMLLGKPDPNVAAERT